MKLTSKELRKRRIVTNAINRTNKILQTFNYQSEIGQRYATELKLMGVNIVNGKLQQPKAKDWSDIQIKDFQLKGLEKYKTAQQIINTQAKELNIKGSQQQINLRKKEIIKEVTDRYNMHEFIETHIEEIYKYEEENGVVVTGNSVPSWDELVKMKNEILSSDKPKKPIKELVFPDN